MRLVAPSNIDTGFYNYDPNQTWNTVTTVADLLATKKDVEALEQKIKELQKKIDELTGPCYCESLL